MFALITAAVSALSIDSEITSYPYNLAKLKHSGKFKGIKDLREHGWIEHYLVWKNGLYIDSV